MRQDTLPPGRAEPAEQCCQLHPQGRQDNVRIRREDAGREQGQDRDKRDGHGHRYERGVLQDDVPSLLPGGGQSLPGKERCGGRTWPLHRQEHHQPDGRHDRRKDQARGRHADKLLPGGPRHQLGQRGGRGEARASQSTSGGRQEAVGYRPPCGRQRDKPRDCDPHPEFARA